MISMVTKKAKKKSTIKKSVPAKKRTEGLHLPSLVIKGFRAFKEIHLPELGRVNLLVGANGAGKSTILEAVQLYASAGDTSVIADVLDSREDVLVREDEEGILVDVPNHESLFFGYDEPKMGDTIEIGLPKAKNVLKIKISNFEHTDLKNIPSSLLPILEAEEYQCLAVSSGSNHRMVEKSPFFHSRKRTHANALPPSTPKKISGRFLGRISKIGTRGVHKAHQIRYESLGPGLPTNERLASWYEAIQLTPHEKPVLEILRLVKPNIERLAAQGGGKFDRLRMMAKIKGVDFPVPLKSMGKGTLHLLALAVALINSKDGFLLIDEVENSIHHSIFPQLWKFVMQTAQENNIQVIATTHSWDCFEGFARVAWEMKDIEGRAIRIDRKGSETWAVPYSEEQALMATKRSIEVR